MDKKAKELIKQNIAALENARWLIQSLRESSAIGGDVEKCIVEEGHLSEMIHRNVRALNEGEGE